MTLDTAGSGEVGGGEGLAAFQAHLMAAGFTGVVGLRVTDLNGAELIAWNADRVFPAASTIKVPLLVLALQEAQAGRLDLSGRVTVQSGDRVPGAGVLDRKSTRLNSSHRT